MSGRKWTREDIITLVHAAAEGKRDQDVAVDLGRSASQVRQARARFAIPGAQDVRRGKTAVDALALIASVDAQLQGGQPTAAAPAPDSPAPPSAESWKEEEAGGARHIASRSTRIRTLEALIEAADIDLEAWQIDRHTINKWEVGAKDDTGKIVVEPLWQVKVWLSRRKGVEALREIEERVIAAMEAHAPVYPSRGPVVIPISRNRHLLEVSAPDLHVGKLAWRAETGDSWDSAIAERVFKDAVEDLLHKASGFAVDRIVFPIGNDLLQIDSAAGTTTGGTPQDTDSRYAKMFARAESLMVYALDRLSELAPVHGVVVPGNHDRQTAFTLGRVLAAWYRHCDRVEIDTSPTLRKYLRYGVNLLGWTHGSEEKHADLPLIMAQEQPEAWAGTTHREWHVGHFHKSKETRFTAGDSFNGVRVRIIPALCAADAWHSMKGYAGPRAAEAYLWNYETGYAGHFSSNVAPTARALAA